MSLSKWGSTSDAIHEGNRLRIYPFTDGRFIARQGRGINDENARLSVSLGWAVQPGHETSVSIDADEEYELMCVQTVANLNGGGVKTVRSIQPFGSNR